MFLITMKYIKPIETVDKYLAEHRNFLEEGYKKDQFIVSGPKNPRNGGVILSQLKNKEELVSIINKDPFVVHEIAEYEITEFNPVKFHKNFESFV